MRHRRLLATAVVVTAVAGLTACGSDEPSAAPSSSTAPTEATTTTATTATTAPPSSYLPVPDGVTLTEPGTELALKEPAVAAWEPRQGVVGVVDVTVARIEQTTVEASLAGFELSDAEQQATPYFVHVRATNAGDTELGDRQLPMYLLDSAGALLPPTGIANDFEPCPGSVLPPVFSPGDDATSCLLFLVPAGHVVASVELQPPVGVEPISWTGTVVPVKSDKPRRTGGGKR